MTSPRIAAFTVARKGIKEALKRLRSLVLGVISKEDASELSQNILELKLDADYALASALIIIGRATASLQDFAEYQTFSNICLPVRHSPQTKGVWTDSVKDCVASHYSCMEALRQIMKSAPKYRKKGHDYCEDMLEMGVRVAMRPGIGRFTRALEKKLGWPSVASSGILTHIPMKPVTQ